MIRKTNSDHGAHRRVDIALSLIAFMAAAIIVVLLPARGVPAWSPDSIGYALAARAIAAGHGVSMLNYGLFSLHYVPYTVWPPLFPLLLSSGLPPLLIQAVLLGCLSGLAFWLLRHVGGVSAPLALPCALIVVLSWPLLLDASYVWSELFAVFWVFLAMLALADPRGTVSASRIQWLLGAVAVALAVYTRYAALVFIPGLMLMLLGAPWPWPSRLRRIAVTPVLIGLMIAPLLVRNLLASGHLSGTARATSHRSVHGLVESVVGYIGWVFGGSGWQQAAFVFCLLGLVAAVSMFYLERRRMGGARPPIDPRARWLAWMSTSVFIAYVVGITGLRAWKHFDLSVRMMSPAMPFLLLALVSWGVVLWRAREAGWERAVLVSPLVGLVMLSGLASAQMGTHAARVWRSSGSPQWPMNRMYTYANLAPIKVPPLQGIILAQRPALMSFRTGWNVRRIPSGHWSHRTLERIARRSRGVFIRTGDSIALARELKAIVKHPRMIPMGGADLLLWGPPQAFEQGRQ